MADVIKPTFLLGKPAATVGVDYLMKRDAGFRKFVYDSFARYANRDWGDICDEDKQLNEQALKIGERVMGVYIRKNSGGRSKIYIITEADRSVTTVLFPEEY